jgi:V8-like Glu-specific endopeptidase
LTIKWNDALTGLIDLLAGLYPDRDRARLAIRRAGLDPDQIDLSGIPKVIWMRAVEEGNRRDRVQALIDVARQDYPSINLDALEQQVREPKGLPPRPKLGDTDWKWPLGRSGSLEKVIGAQPTFLPISFLEAGLVRARAVARVEGPRGVGTGFLTRDNLLVTNNHVLASPDDARRARVWFNYEMTVTGTQAVVVEYSLDPADAFATSPSSVDDWTAVRVLGDTARWGHLELIDVSLAAEDFVNIVQHPGGLPKQIALYHNVVTYADERRVQYLTDTMPGSSGSPVFNSAWCVVALHHRGGWVTEPGTGKVYFRNEGIRVALLINGLRACGLFRD